MVFIPAYNQEKSIMMETLLSILIGSAAGVFTFICCMLIWGVNLKRVFLTVKELSANDNLPSGTEEFSSSITESPMRLSVDIKQQELALTKEGAVIIGSYINIERNLDGMQTNHRIFLN